MWSTRLLVLGLVRWLGPVHGYLVRREIDSWRMPGVSEVGAGSVYHALKKLTGDGLIEVDSTESVDDRPARTSYRITVEGEAEFQRLLREKLWEAAPIDDPFHTAWSFANVLGRAENTALLRQRADTLYRRIDACTALLASSTDRFTTGREQLYMPAHVRALLRRQIDLWLADAEWCESTAGRIEAGELDLGGEIGPEQAAAWRESIRDGCHHEVVEQWHRAMD
ncbi:PadR family transcriptional regulator [Glycomyces xiaoerkulensis]|uniref:PadR family transcriptional regulator n=1 Tax=Glycomyces xiaoerkulensis TaxID=2038139 RepID=UPI0012FFD566|nr:PadR family transcriptional regulator [Glycomyces xiaoerkulensis]